MAYHDQLHLNFRTIKTAANLISLSLNSINFTVTLIALAKLYEEPKFGEKLIIEIRWAVIDPNVNSKI